MTAEGAATLSDVQTLAVGSPKGGVGKTTCAGTLAVIAARVMGLRVLLVDADPNGSAVDWMGDADELDVTEGLDHDALRRLRDARGPRTYDLAVVDLPGARVGAFQAVLSGAVADVLVMPTAPEVMDVRPVRRVIRTEVMPLGVPYLVVLAKVAVEALPRARQRQGELREESRLTVADTIIRRFVAYDEAVERSRTVLDLGGAHHYARRAEEDYRSLAGEVFELLGHDTMALRKKEE